MASKIALITGITGQDGALLANFLLDKGYDVHGLVRWDSHLTSIDGLQRFDALGLVGDAVTLHTGDMTDVANLAEILKAVRPNEIYNLAALSQVAVSFETPTSTFDINAKGTLNLLEAVRILDMQPDVRIYQASSSEMYGSSPAPQNEDTPFAPCSPYGVAKLAAYWLVRTYRESYDFHVSNGVLFNHESSLRGEDFVTRKITKAVAAIEAGAQQSLALGNLDSIRDWGHARDYIEGMWLMLQQELPGDYVLATGEAHTVREFVERCFRHIGVQLIWRGAGVDEVGVDAKTEDVLVRVDVELFRPMDVNHLLGDASKAKEVLGWAPRIYFDELVVEMLNADRRHFWDGKEGSWPQAQKMVG